MKVLLLLVLTAYVGQSQNISTVTVKTSKGLIRGRHINLGNNTSQLFYGEADIFLGIPYAKPPVGQLRFRKPVEIDEYEGVWDAQKYAPRCLQNDDPLNPFPQELMMSEDCLYLNVFTRQTSSANKHPVMIFIDGGNSFTTGGSNPKQMKGTIRNFVMRDIVVVTIQYRLGALGFFTTYNSEFPANLGLLDQVKAIEWVRREIHNFGGDPDEITLCGQNDGACSVKAHTLSPISQRLFKRAILQSGSIQGCFSITPEGGYIDIHVDDGTDRRININKEYFENFSTFLENKTLEDLGNQTEYSNSATSDIPFTVTSASTFTTSVTTDADYDTSTTTSTTSSTTTYTTTSTTASASSSTTTVDPASNEETAPLTLSDNPSQQFAIQACNMTAEEWRKGQLSKLNSCMHNLTFDIYLKVDGTRTSAWMIVRDNYFMPDSVENLAKQRPHIPIIIGTVQDEDASYAFKLVANGEVSEDKNKVFNNWFADFARKQGVSGEDANKASLFNGISGIQNSRNVTKILRRLFLITLIRLQMRNIIAQNYDIETTDTTSVPVSQATDGYSQPSSADNASPDGSTTTESSTANIATELLYYEEFGTTRNIQTSSFTTASNLDLKSTEAESSSSTSDQQMFTSTADTTLRNEETEQSTTVSTTTELTFSESYSSSTRFSTIGNQHTSESYETTTENDASQSTVIYHNNDHLTVSPANEQQLYFDTTQEDLNEVISISTHLPSTLETRISSSESYTTSSTDFRTLYIPTTQPLLNTFDTTSSSDLTITVSSTLENTQQTTVNVTSSYDNLAFTPSNGPPKVSALEESSAEYSTSTLTTPELTIETLSTSRLFTTTESPAFVSEDYIIPNDYATSPSYYQSHATVESTLDGNSHTTTEMYYMDTGRNYYGGEAKNTTDPSQNIEYNSTSTFVTESPTTTINPTLPTTVEMNVLQNDQQNSSPTPLYQQPTQGNLCQFEGHYLVQVSLPCYFNLPCNSNQNQPQYPPVSLDQPTNISPNIPPASSSSKSANLTQSFPLNTNEYSSSNFLQYDIPQIISSPGKDINEEYSQPVNQYGTPNTLDENRINPPPVQTYQDSTIPPNCNREAVIEALKTITKISSDANVVSGTSKEINSLLSNGNTNVRVFEFAHVTQIGCGRTPNIQPWQPVYQGVDVLFLWMDEDIWSNANHVTTQDIQVANDLSGKWAEFVKTGIISNWQPTTPQNNQYCKITVNPQMSQGYGATANTVFNELISRAVTYTNAGQQQQIAQGEQKLNSVQQRQATQLGESRFPPAQQQQQQQHSNNQPQLSWSISLSLPDLIINF